jgi:hypothetical protein
VAALVDLVDLAGVALGADLLAWMLPGLARSVLARLVAPLPQEVPLEVFLGVFLEVYQDPEVLQVVHPEAILGVPAALLLVASVLQVPVLYVLLDLEVSLVVHLEAFLAGPLLQELEMVAHRAQDLLVLARLEVLACLAVFPVVFLEDLPAKAPEIPLEIPE